MNCRFACLAALALAAVGYSGRSAPSTDALTGSWRVVAMQLVEPDGQTASLRVHESLFMFADGHYSMGCVFGNQRPAAYAQRWRPTDAEKVARFGAMLASSGTYALTGSRLITRPLFALAPEFVGGRAEYSFEFVGDTLRLSWEKSVAFDGLEYPTGGTVTVFRLVRAD